MIERDWQVDWEACRLFKAGFETTEVFARRASEALPYWLQRVRELEARARQMEEVLERARKAPFEAQNIMREHGFKFDNLDDPMQKWAFTFYTMLCELSEGVRQLKEEAEDDA